MDFVLRRAAAIDRLDMKRADLTEKLLDLKREHCWNWKYICEQIGGSSEVLIVGAILGQMKLTKPQAANAAELFGLSKSESRDAQRNTDARLTHAADRSADLSLL